MCKFLFHTLPIDHFSYIELDKVKNTRGLLTTNPDWLQHFYTNIYYLDPFIFHNDYFLRNGSYLWSEIVDKKPIAVAKALYNLHHGITIVRADNQSAMIYCFGSSTIHLDCQHVFVSHLDILEQFILYFNDTARELMVKVRQYTLEAPLNTLEASLTDRTNKVGSLNVQKINQERNHKFRPKRYIINRLGLYLTEKELLCVVLGLRDYTADQIGHLLHISPRTVEKHFELVKQKLGCRSRTRMTREIMQSPWFEVLQVQAEKLLGILLSNTPEEPSSSIPRASSYAELVR